MLEVWQQLFPTATIHSYDAHFDDMIVIQIDTSSWLHIPSAQLSERERMIIATLQQKTIVPAQYATQPWHLYLQGNLLEMPDRIEKIQFVYITVHSMEQSIFSAQEWKEVMKTFFPNCMDIIELPECFVFILNQTPMIDYMSTIVQSLSMVEEDFACRMNIFIGHTWLSTVHKIPQMFRAEKELFAYYLHISNNRAVCSFSEILLWSLPHSMNAHKPIFQALHQSIALQEDMGEIIEAMWNEQATLTKAAQRLYLHRNTLQYRIERFKEITGFSLKQMNDLAICFMALNYD